MSSVHPTHIGNTRLLATSPPFLQHAYFGIERYHFIERTRQNQLQHARPASHIEELTGAVEQQFVLHDPGKLFGAWRTPF